jgi:hypothetical protein
MATFVRAMFFVMFCRACFNKTDLVLINFKTQQSELVVLPKHPLPFSVSTYIMRSFLAFLPFFALVHTNSASEHDLIVPLEVGLRWSNAKRGLRASCNVQEVNNIDTLLGTELSGHMVGVKGFLQSSDLAQDDLLPCHGQSCARSFGLVYIKVKHLDLGQMKNNVQHQLESACSTVLVELSNDDVVYSHSCRRALSGATCEATFTLGDFGSSLA